MAKKNIKLLREEVVNLKRFSVEVNEMGLFLAVVIENYGYPQLVITNISPSESGSIGDVFFVFSDIYTHNGIVGRTPVGVQQKIRVYPFKERIRGMAKRYNDARKINFKEENIKKLKDKK